MNIPQQKQPNLLMTRRFLPMFLTQFFGALNDNLYKYVILLVFTYGWINTAGLGISMVNNLAALLFILPFFIFSATAGQIADRYERSNLMQWLKISEISIMIFASIGFFVHNIWILLLALFLMGIHSAFFGPIKYAILPEILQEKELMLGNALFQSATSVAILLGMILGGVVVYYSKSGSFILICATVITIAIMGYLSSRMILKQKIADPELKINWNFFVTSWQIMKLSYGLPLIFLILLANSWYWFYGSMLLTQMTVLTEKYLHGNENVSSLLLTFFSVGVVIGSVLCKRLSGSSLNIKLVPFGAAGLTIFAYYLAWSLDILPIIVGGEYFAIADIFQQDWRYWHVFIAITLLGASGGFYIVPLYAMMQAKSPESHRARIVAANNIFNAIFMVASAIFSIIILSLLQLSLLHLFMISGILNAIVTIILILKIRSKLCEQ